MSDIEKIGHVDMLAAQVFQHHRQSSVDDLRSRGVRIEEYQAPDPVTVNGVADMGHSWAAWFVDPSQNVLAVVQPKG